MNYLLASATTLEISPFLDLPAAQRQGVDVLITGVGLTAATYALATRLHEQRYDVVIQAGIAGCFDPLIGRGQVFAIAADVIADQGVMENNEWKSTMDMGFTDPGQLPYQQGWLLNPHRAMFGRSSLTWADAVTVNQVSTDPRMITEIRSKYQPTLESMEGAALHFVAISRNIPFIQLRSVSNGVGDRDKKNWDFRGAIANLHRELVNLLPQ